MEHLRQALKGKAPPVLLPALTNPAEKREALELLAEHTVQLSRIDAEVDAYRAAIKANRLRRRAGDRK